MNLTPWSPHPTIALVDPDPQSHQVVQAALSTRFAFLSATTAEAALRVTCGQPIWLWLVSAHLPDMSGADFCRLLRMRNSRTPIVVVGEAGAADDEVACRSAGGTYFFAKPLEPGVFAAIVAQLDPVAQRPAVRPQALGRRSFANSPS